MPRAGVRDSHPVVQVRKYFWQSDWLVPPGTGVLTGDNV